MLCTSPGHSRLALSNNVNGVAGESVPGLEQESGSGMHAWGVAD